MHCAVAPHGVAQQGDIHGSNKHLLGGYMGTSRLFYRPPGKNAKVQEENPRKTRGKSRIFIASSRNCWSKPIPKPPENPSDHFEPISASLDPSRTILHHFYIFDFFLKKKCHFFRFFFEVFPIFSLFFELGELRDHSQIVDLIFPLLTVASRPSESPKTPHS